MKGLLDFDLTPYVSLFVGASDGSHDSNSNHECVVDTGFSVALYLPEDKVATLNLPFISSIPVMLANQSSVIAAAYEGTVFWFGSRLQVSVLAGPSGCD